MTMAIKIPNISLSEFLHHIHRNHNVHFELKNVFVNIFIHTKLSV